MPPAKGRLAKGDAAGARAGAPPEVEASAPSAMIAEAAPAGPVAGTTASSPGAATPVFARPSPELGAGTASSAPPEAPSPALLLAFPGPGALSAAAAPGIVAGAMRKAHSPAQAPNCDERKCCDPAPAKDSQPGQLPTSLPSWVDSLTRLAVLGRSQQFSPVRPRATLRRLHARGTCPLKGRPWLAARANTVACHTKTSHLYARSLRALAVETDPRLILQISISLQPKRLASMFLVWRC